MKTSLNSANLGKDRLDLDALVMLAAKHGFDGIDFGMASVINKFGEGNPSAARDFFAADNVIPAVFGLDVEWRKDDKTFDDGLPPLRRHAAYAQKIGTTRCCTWMPPAVNGDLSVWHTQTINRFRTVADILGEHDLRFGLEWVGPHHLRANGANAMGATDWIHSLPATLDLITEIGAPNIGLLVDSYHCYTTGIGETEIAKLTDNQIVHVHINDTSATPEMAEDGKRLLPGSGIINLAAFLRGLKAASYTGFIAAEILTPKPLAEDSDEGAAMVRESLAALGL